jgi:signal transduction histidine kinase
VEIASTAAEKLMRLINDYLDYAKIDAGYLHLERAATDLVEVARRAAATAALQAGVKNLRLSVDVPAAGVVAIADGAKLEQALENLLSNAIKYTEAGTITLSLHFGNERARLTVADTGAGIDPKLIPTLFAKYHRLTGDATRASPGTGLGLLIAKEIVEAHGGHITATSTGVNGEGTSFVIDIPRSTPVSSIEDAKALVAG